MKREQKSLTNKGFSLVELIIVVAIMAVLIGVLAPQYLRYVEKTRLQKDNTNMADFANVVKISCTEEGVNTKITGTVQFEFDATTLELKECSVAELNEELAKTLNYDATNKRFTDVVLSSSTYTKGTKPVIKVTLNSANVVTVSCDGWIEAPGESALTGSNAKKF